MKGCGGLLKGQKDPEAMKVSKAAKNTGHLDLALIWLQLGSLEEDS